MTNYSWAGGNGDWNDAADWSPTGTPGVADNASLPAGGAYVVTVASATEVDGLVIGMGATLDVASALGVHGDFDNGGSLDVAADQTLTVWNSLSNTGVLDLAATGTALFESSLTTAELGSVDWTSGSTLFFRGTLFNDGATFDVAPGEQVEGAVSGGTIEGTVDIVGVAGADMLTLAGGPTFVGAGGAGPGVINDTGNDAELIFSGVETIANATINVGGPYVYEQNLSSPTISISADSVVTFAANTTIDLAEDGSPTPATATIEGAGKVVNDGSLFASIDGGVFTLDVTTFTNAGSIDISDGARLSIAPATFVNSGSISVDATSIVGFYSQMTTAQLGVVDAAAGAQLYFAALNNSGATFAPGADPIVSGTISGGTIEGELRAGSNLYFQDSPTFIGAGGVGQAEIEVGGDDYVAYVATGQTIGNVDFDLTTSRAEYVQGNLIVDSVTMLVGTTITGAGTALFDGDSTIAGNVDDSSVFDLVIGAGISIEAGDTLALGGAATIGGAVSGAGELAISGFGARVTVDFGADIQVATWSLAADTDTIIDSAGFAYDGAFTLASEANLDLAGSHLILDGEADFDGGSVLGSKNLLTEGTTDVSGLSLFQTVIWLNYGTTALGGGNVTLYDDAILANTSTGVYDIMDDSGVSLGDEAGSSVSNAGLFEKTGGSGLSTIAPNFDNTGKIKIASGGLDFLGQLWGAGQIDVEAGATLAFGATPGGAATSSVGVNSAMTFGAGSTLALDGVNVGSTGPVDFDGATIAGDDRLSTFGDVSVAGLTLGGTTIWANYGVATQAGGDLVVGDASGAAAIFYNLASGVYDITDDSGVGVGGSTGAPYINNAGLFEKTGGSGVSAIAANIYSKGTISVASGTLDFQAALWGPGTSYAKAGGTVEVDGIVGAGSILAFSGSGGVISLDDLDDSGVKLFHGSISGFAAGDTIDIGAPFGAGTSPLFTENMAGTGGILTLTDGPTTASIAMTGVYSSSNFTPITDGHGGTLLTFHA